MDDEHIKGIILTGFYKTLYCPVLDVLLLGTALDTGNNVLKKALQQAHRV